MVQRADDRESGRGGLPVENWRWDGLLLGEGMCAGKTMTTVVHYTGLVLLPGDHCSTQSRNILSTYLGPDTLLGVGVGGGYSSGQDSIVT